MNFPYRCVSLYIEFSFAFKCCEKVKSLDVGQCIILNRFQINR